MTIKIGVKPSGGGKFAEMTMVEARAPKGNDRRTEILDVARDLLLTQGYDKTSMRNIAARLNVTPTTLYLYFKNKDELVFHLMEETFSILWADLAEVAEPVGDPVERLRRGLDIYVRFGLDHPDHYRVVFMRLPPDTRVTASQHAPEPGDTNILSEQAFRLLRGAVDACIDAGRFRPVDAIAAAEMLWASVHGLTAMVIRSSRALHSPHDVLIRLQLDTLIRGLLA